VSDITSYMEINAPAGKQAGSGSFNPLNQKQETIP